MKQKETGFFFRNGFSNFLSTRGNALVRTPLNVMLIAMALIVVTSCTTTKGNLEVPLKDRGTSQNLRELSS